jgi:phenylalanyl-tRNA synthetase beta chain
MGVSLDWVRDYVDLQDVSLEGIASALRMSGLYLRPKHPDFNRSSQETLDSRSFNVEAPFGRQDWLGVIGIARELAARLNKPWTWSEPRPARDPLLSVEPHLKISLQNVEACHRLVALRLGDVPHLPSPQWMQVRLLAAGIKSTHLVVDAAQFVMLEYHQPIHVFDEKRVSGATLRMAQASRSHTLITTDGRQLNIETGDLLIEDSNGPVSLAGIADAQETGIDATTDRVIVVCGAFAPSLLAKTINRLGLSKEGASRFACGTDLTMVPYAALRVAELVSRATEESCHFHSPFRRVQTSKDMVDLGVRPTGSRLIAMRLSHGREFLGISHLNRNMVTQALTRFSFRFVDGNEDRLVFDIPSFRPDIEREIDLIAELSRIFGVELVPPCSLSLPRKGTPFASSTNS